jgi:hypothetical protein
MFGTEYVKFKCLDDIDDDLFVVSTGTRGSINASTGSVVIKNGGLSILSTENSSSASRGGALTVGGGIAINGDVHFSGSLFKNGAEYESQWTETAGNISYTSGNVFVGSLLANSVSLGMSNIYTGSFMANNNVNTPTDVTGVVFSSGVNYFTSTFSVVLKKVSGDLYQFFDLSGYKTGNSGWELFLSKRGEDTNIDFNITSSGQLQYTSPNTPDFIDCTFRYTITQITDSGIYNSSAIGTNGNYIFDKVQITNTENAVSNTSYGGLRVYGGATFEKNIVVNGTENKIGQLFATDTTIGIGTTSPGYDLDVNGNINFTGDLYQNGDPFQTSQWTSGSNGNLSYTGGNIGIGTTVPNEALDVLGNINFTGDLYQNGDLFQTSQWTNGSNGNLFYTGGNVGIGTTAPSEQLDVAGNINFTGDLYQNGDLYVGSQWTSGTDGSVSYTTGSVVLNELNFITLSSTSPNYNLGSFQFGFSNGFSDANFSLVVGGFSGQNIRYIGTTTKTFQVRLTGTGATIPPYYYYSYYYYLSVLDQSGNFINTIYSVELSEQNTSFDTGFITVTLQPNHQLFFTTYYGGGASINSVSFQYTTNTPPIIRNFSAVSSSNTLGSLITTTGGNVGIGTGSPSQRLHVNGGGVLVKQAEQSNNNSSRFYNGLTFVNPGTNHAYAIGYNEGGFLSFNHFNPDNSIYTNIMTLTGDNRNVSIPGSLNVSGNSNTLGSLITTGGNVGIGTTAPSQRLHVAGNINFSGDLYKNGSLYVGSQWTSGTDGSVSYTSGSVVATDMTVGNLNFTGDLYQNGSLYVGSQWTSGTDGSVSYTSGSVALNELNFVSLGTTSPVYDLGHFYGASGGYQNDLIDSNFEMPPDFRDWISYKGVSTKTFNVRFTFTNISGNPSGIREIIVYDSNGNEVSTAYTSSVSSSNLDTGFFSVTLQPQDRLVIGFDVDAVTFQYTINIPPIITGFSAVSSSNTLGSLITTTTGNVGIGTTAPSQRLHVAGNINFSGDLYQNGSLYVGSQWTSGTDGSVSYTSGSVVATDMTVGNLNFTGDLYKNGSLYTSSQWTSATDGSVSYTSGNVIVSGMNLVSIQTTSELYDLGQNDKGSFPERASFNDSNFFFVNANRLQYSGTTTKTFQIRFTGSAIESDYGPFYSSGSLTIGIYQDDYDPYPDNIIYSLSGITDINTGFDTGFITVTLEPGNSFGIEAGSYVGYLLIDTVTFQYVTDSIPMALSSTGSLSLSGDLSAKSNSNTVGNLFTTGGNIGIGTSSPVNILSIKGTGGTTATLSFYNSGNPVPYVGLGYDQTSDGLAFYYNAASPVLNSTGMFINRSGNIGIGTTSPEYKLHVAGNIYSSGELISFSDKTLKKDIFTITDALEKVKNLRGVYYTNTETNDKGVGLIAQEVQEILPEVVKSGEKLGVAYGNIVGVLIEAVKELTHRLEVIENKN